MTCLIKMYMVPPAHVLNCSEFSRTLLYRYATITRTSFRIVLIFSRTITTYPMKTIFLILATLISLPLFSEAAEPSIWTVSTRADVLKGDSRGVSIDANGAITLAPKLTEIYKTEQPYIWSSVIDANGNVFLGTGSDGRIYKVTPSGTGSMLADLAELNVSALAIGRGGELFAATSPDGKVYRVDA